MVTVIAHTSVSADGHVDGFMPDLAAHYEVAAQLGADVHLAGSTTILAAGLAEDPPDGPPPPPSAAGDDRTLLAVVDSGGVVRCYDALRAAPHWRDHIVALSSQATPAAHLDHLRRRHVEVAVVGRDRVDLAAALDWLERGHGAARVMVDSGGALTGALLHADLLDGLSLLVHPTVAGGRSPVQPPVGADAVPLRLRSVTEQPGGLLWLRWDVVREPAAGDG